MELPLVENSVTKTIEIGDKIFVVRPWKTKEEKNYFIKKALLSKKGKDINMKDIDDLMTDSLIRPCIIQGNMDELSFTEIKYLMIQIRIISIGEEVEGVIFKCENEKCGKSNESTLNFEKEGVLNYKGVFSEFRKVSDDLEVKFRSVPFKSLTNIQDGKEEMFLYYSIDRIRYLGKEYDDFTKENFEEFFDSLDINTTKKLVKELENNMEKLSIVQSYSCMFCGTVTKIEFDEMPNFFLP